MIGEELEHQAVEQPGLLDLTGVAGAGRTFNSQLGNPGLERNELGRLPSSLPVRMIIGQAMRS